MGIFSFLFNKNKANSSSSYAFSKLELKFIIEEIEKLIKTVRSNETYKAYQAFGSYSQELDLLNKLGSILCDYYRNVYKYGRISNFKVIKYDKNRDQILKELSDNWENVEMMLINLSTVGTVEDVRKIRLYKETVGKYSESLFPRLLNQ